MILVALVDDHPVVRRGLRETLVAERDIEVMGEAARAEDVSEVLARGPCHVLLLDVSLPGRGGVDVLKDVRREHPNVRVLMISTHDEYRYAISCIRAGAAGYLTKNAAPEELIRAVRTVVRTGHYLTDTVAGLLVEHAATPHAEDAYRLLSDRERQVFEMLAAGRTVSDIAARLSLSVKTISTYRARVLEKLGARSTADLVRYALAQGLIE